MSANYPTDFFGRTIVLNNAQLAAGTYKRGQLLGPHDGGVFSAYASTDEAVGAVCVNDITLAAQGNAAICRGEFEKEGMIALNASLTTPITINAEVIAQCWDAGIVLN